MNRYQIERVFGSPEPLKDFQVKRLHQLQQGFYQLAKDIVEHTPSVPERDSALDLLEQAYIMAQNAARRPRSVVTPDVVRHSFHEIEKTNDLVVRVWLNINDFVNLRKFGRDVFDSETKAESLRKGFQGKLWNTEVWIKRSIPEGYAFLIGSNDGDADLDPAWIPDVSKLVRL